MLQFRGGDFVRLGPTSALFFLRLSYVCVIGSQSKCEMLFGEKWRRSARKVPAVGQRGAYG